MSEISNDINEIWASMNASSREIKPMKILNNKNKSNLKSIQNKETKNNETKAINSNEKRIAEREFISSVEMRAKIARDINALSDEDSTLRKKSIIRLFKTLFEDFSLSENEYDEIFRDICKPIFKRFNDPIEKCREMAHKITHNFFEKCFDLVPILGYYFPALMQRQPPGMAYDEEMKVFVTDMEAHEAYRRGKAVDRQDKGGATGILTHQVLEVAEEIRFISCTTLNALIQRVIKIGSSPILHPYFQEIVMLLQLQLRDPYPELKIIACNALESLAKVEDFVPGMKFFSIGLVRAILPVLRHRHAKVRVAALSALFACMVVPDHSKRKASGSEAIADLVGFREDNVIQVASFYKSDVQINYLAELVLDKSSAVKEKLVEFLTVLLTEIGDRYDHQTRIIPYLLDLMTDENPTVANGSLTCLVKCGKQYEEEHANDIIEKRQYGVDGDDRINLSKPLPPPFVERPRIGIRLYVRGNTKRFLFALVNELTNWVSTTRIKSAQLLKLIIVLCEEHLTMEANVLFPAFIKALRFARDDKDLELKKILLELFELLGRYIVPELYVYYILPRLRGDVDVIQFGVDSETRITVLEFLQSLLEGSKASLIIPLFEEIVNVLIDPFVISIDFTNLQLSAIDVIITIFNAIKGQTNKVIESHFVSTGRLTNLQKTIRNLFKYLLISISIPELNKKASIALDLLSKLETYVTVGLSGIEALFAHHSVFLFKYLLSSDYEIDSNWLVTMPEHELLCRLVECPGSFIQRDSECLHQFLSFLTESIDNVESHGLDSNIENDILYSFAELLINVLYPIYYISFESKKQNVYKEIFNLEKDKNTFKYIQIKDTCYIQNGISALDNNNNNNNNRDIVSELFNNLIKSFVFDIKWNRTPKLQMIRLTVLKLFCGVTNQLNELNKNSSILLKDDITIVNYFNIIIESVIPTAASPSNSLSLRREAVDLLSFLLDTMNESAGFYKLKSFDYWKQNNNNNNNNNNKDLIKYKLASKEAFSSILVLLKDTNDEIRISILEILAKSVSLLLSDDEVAILVSNNNNNDNNNSNNNNNNGYISSYKYVLNNLMKDLKITLETDIIENSVIEQFDSTLRVFAVLDCKVFEQVIREEVKEIENIKNSNNNNGDERQKKFIENYLDILSCLITHVDLISQLNSK